MYDSMGVDTAVFIVRSSSERSCAWTWYTYGLHHQLVQIQGGRTVPYRSCAIVERAKELDCPDR